NIGPLLGIDVTKPTMVVMNWWGRPDYVDHIYLDGSEPDPETATAMPLETVTSIAIKVLRLFQIRRIREGQDDAVQISFIEDVDHVILEAMKIETCLLNACPDQVMRNLAVMEIHLAQGTNEKAGNVCMRRNKIGHLQPTSLVCNHIYAAV